MSPVRNQLNMILDSMEEKDLYLLLTVLGRFNQIDPDDILTQEDIEAHRQTIEEYERGELIDLDDI